MRSRSLWPRPKSRAVKFATGTSSPAVPFDDANRTVALEARLNDTPVRALLDTGAGGNVLDEGRAKSLGLRPVTLKTRRLV